MGNYYTGRRTQHYNTRWRGFNEKTLGEALATIDIAALRSISERLGRSPRVLENRSRNSRFDLMGVRTSRYGQVLASRNTDAASLAVFVATSLDV